MKTVITRARIRIGAVHGAIDRKEIEAMSGKHSLHDIEEAEKKPLWQRLGWLAMIWAGSVGALFIVASLMRMFMNAAGLSTH
ncbi:hypothetical protein PMI35_06491 [Pseudomonas sp. GM78]|nr:hypothetical protein PMI35_06491 [Pseudomonas sp. GM78]